MDIKSRHKKSALMVDDKEQHQPNVADQTDRDHANIETERAASFRTTVPEFMSPPAVESATNAIRENETVAYHSESAPQLPSSATAVSRGCSAGFNMSGRWGRERSAR